MIMMFATPNAIPQLLVKPMKPIEATPNKKHWNSKKEKESIDVAYYIKD